MTACRHDPSGFTDGRCWQCHPSFESRPDRLVTTGPVEIHDLAPRRFIIYAGKGRWIVTDRQAPTEDEFRSWTDAAAGWGGDGGPSVLYVTECVPLDERLMAPVRWTVGAEPEERP
jgi:hypothetical protein